jgi:PEP-CTERM/exosortase A-associated glycosyltransferase
MSLRVLHILDHSIPLHSGYTFRTLSILKAQRALGWETFMLTSPKHGKVQAREEDIDGWHFFRTPAQSARLPVWREWRLMRATERRLEEVARRVKPQVLHAHSPALNALPALRVGRKLGIPVVYEVRAFWEDAAVDHGTSTEWGLRYRMTRALETYALRRADRVTCICEGLRQDIVARGIPAEKVTVIPNAVDTEKFIFGRTADAALRKELGLEGATVLGFIGSYYAYEGLDLFLEAVPRMRASHPDLRVLLVGGGPEEEKLKRQTRTLGIADIVRFVGRVPNAEVQRYYDMVDVLVYARHRMRLTELVTPLKPLEAMAQGKLFIASDVGGHRELVQDGVTGYLFPAGDAGALVAAVDRVLSERTGWEKMRRAQRHFVEAERTWARSVSRYSDIYPQPAAQP